MLTQESAAIEILLVCCQEVEGDGGRLRALLLPASIFYRGH